MGPVMEGLGWRALALAALALSGFVAAEQRLARPDSLPNRESSFIDGCLWH